MKAQGFFFTFSEEKCLWVSLGFGKKISIICISSLMAFRQYKSCKNKEWGSCVSPNKVLCALEETWFFSSSKGSKVVLHFEYSACIFYLYYSKSPYRRRSKVASNNMDLPLNASWLWIDFLCSDIPLGLYK